jgi:WD40 repeat protein/tRNA A-37 threonylcarbamoyl transferase component Bud32
MDTEPSPSSREQQVNEAIAAHLEAVDAGQAPDRKAFIAAHPDIATDLESFFADRDQFDRLADPLIPSAPVPPADAAEAPTMGPSETVTVAPGDRIRYFGDYELLEEIARGGMGVVYKARQVSLNRTVALKMILAGQLASEAEVQRFHTEAEAAANLDHSNIVPIYEVGEHEGQHYFSMKLIEGSSLAKAVSGSVWPVATKETQQRAARLLAAVARAVHHAHQRGILHRDLKPSNILLDVQGDPHVTDFGLARRIQADSKLTQSGAIVGTPSYMSPEQARSEKILTTAVDVYSLGALLYEFLTGRPPFQAATPMDTLLQVLDQEPTAPHYLNVKTDRDLETICLKCLEKDPSRRISSSDEFAKELERWLAGEPIHSRATTGWEKTVKWAKRRPAVAALLLVSALGALGMLTLAAFLWRNAEARAVMVQNLSVAQTDLRAAEEEKRIVATEVQSKRAEVLELVQKAAEVQLQAKAAKESARRSTYAADMQLAQAAWEADDVPRFLSLLEKYRKDQDLRGFEWDYLWRLCHGERLTMQAPPDGDQLRQVSDPVSKRLRHFTDRLGVPSIIPSKPAPTMMALCPDGKLFATLGLDKKIHLWNLLLGKHEGVIPAPPGVIISLGFLPDGKTLLVIRTRQIGSGLNLNLQNIQDIKDVMTGKGKPSLQKWCEAFEFLQLDTQHPETVKADKFDPGRLVVPMNMRNAYASEPEVSTAMASAVVFLNGRFFTVFYVAVSPDHHVLALGGVFIIPPAEPFFKQEAAVLLWDLAKNQEMEILKGEGGMISSLAWAPDGKTLAAGYFDKVVRIWDVEAGKERATLRGHATVVNDLAYSPNSRALATASDDGIVKLWDAITYQLQTTLKGHTTAVSQMAFSRDSQKLITVDWDHSIKIWNATDRQGPSSPQGLEKLVKALAFSGDGKTLIALDQGGYLRFLDWRTGKEQAKKKNIDMELISFDNGHAFSPDGKTVAVQSSEDIRLYDLASAKSVRSIRVGQAVVDAIVLSPDNKTLGAGFCSSKGDPGQIKEWKWWDIATGQEVASPKGDYHDTQSIAFSPDGQRVAAARADTVTIRDLTTGKVTLTIHCYSHQPGVMAFSPDGQRLVTGSKEGEVSSRGSGLKLWDLVSGQEVLRLGSSSDVIAALAFSADGKQLAAASASSFVFDPFLQTAGELKIWDSTPAIKIRDESRKDE